jgi:hypothetical protein
MTIHATLEARAQTLTSLVLVHSRKVALMGGMLAVGSVMAVAIHSTGSSAAVVAASEHWVSASGVVVVASEIEGAAFALASMASSSMVA